IGGTLVQAKVRYAVRRQPPAIPFQSRNGGWVFQCLRRLRKPRIKVRPRNGRGDNAGGPCGKLALSVERTGETLVVVGPIEVVLHVVFPRPEQLYRFFYFLCDLPCLGGVIPLIPPAE